MAANCTIGKTEILFLREHILGRYTSLVGYDYQEFERGLTGTRNIYDNVVRIMEEYLDDASNLKRYAALLKEGPLRLQLRKWLESLDRDRKEPYPPSAWKQTLSDHVLMKLLFIGGKPETRELSFREDFIAACYFYIHYDRAEFLRNHQSPSSSKKTVRPAPAATGEDQQTRRVFAHPSGFVLKKLTEDGALDPQNAPLSFSGDKASLHRANLEPENLTITSKVQAEIVRVDGEWYLENKSQLKTTFIMVDRPVRIRKGDVIVMGNRKFLFDEP